MARRRKVRSKVKRKIAKMSGIPTTRSGRHAKLGRMMTGGGCMLPMTVLAGIVVIVANVVL